MREAALRTDLRRRGDLERELDRAHAAVSTQQMALGHRLNWLLLSQGLLLNAFVILLVFGWTSPLPGWRMLLAGLALAGVALAGLVDVALRGGRDAAQALRATRSELEIKLEKEFNRSPRHRSDAGPERGLGAFAARALPATFIAGWIGLSLYALALPPSAKAFEEAQRAPQTVEPAAAKDSVPPSTGRRSPFNS